MLLFIEILSISLVTEAIGFSLYKSLYFESYATMSMLVFRAWATCDETQSPKIITFLSAKTGFLVQSHWSPQKLNLDPSFLSRELLFQGTIRKPKHRRNVFMAGTEYFGETAQPLDHIPVNTMR